MKFYPEIATYPLLNFCVKPGGYDLVDSSAFVANSSSQMASWLFEQLVERSGLSSIFATTAMKRACERSGIQIAFMTRTDLTKALPDIRRALEVYLPPPEVDERMDEIGRLAGAR